MEGIRGGPDMPSVNLLNVMAEHNYKAPANWKGVRFMAGI